MELYMFSEIFIAIFIGISVSMDVSGYNLAMASDKKYSSRPKTQSYIHAFWHGLFISLGIGGVAFIGEFLDWIIVKYDLYWMFEWIIVLLPWFDSIFFAKWLLVIVGIALWVKLYWSKIRGPGEGEHIPNWFSWILKNIFRVRLAQFAYIAVAMDMWFLTPLLQSIVEDYNTYGKIGFVIVVTATVFTCSMLSMSYGRSLMRTKHVESLFYWTVTLIWVEPLITGYFVVRATWWVYTGEMKSEVLFIFITGVVVIAMCTGKFKAIMERHLRQAQESAGKIQSAIVPQ